MFQSKTSGNIFLLRSYQKKRHYVFFAVQSESGIRFFAVEPINMFFLIKYPII